MRVIVAILGVIGMAAVGAWLIAWNNCVNLMPAHPQIDYLCGHNIGLQLIPLFFLLSIVFAIFAGIVAHRLKKRRSSSR